MTDSPLHQAKRILTIPVLWRAFGLPGNSTFFSRLDAGQNVVTNSPFREDKRPSFAIWSHGGEFYFKDCNERAFPDVKGDSFSFFKLYKGITNNKQAVAEFCQQARVGLTKTSPGFTKAGPVKKVQEPLRKPKARNWDKGKLRDWEMLGRQRHGIPVSTIQNLVEAGYVRFGWYKPDAQGELSRAWFVTDREGWNAQARILNQLPGGTAWKCASGENPKALTVKGFKALYPVGLSSIGDKDTVCLAEGGPDFIAAWHFVLASKLQDKVHPLGLLGANVYLTEKVLDRLSEKKVIIFQHNDEKKGKLQLRAGEEAAKAWKEQLEGVGCKVHIVDFAKISDAIQLPSPVKDLNDLIPHQRKFRPERLFSFFLQSPLTSRLAESLKERAPSETVYTLKNPIRFVQFSSVPKGAIVASNNPDRSPDPRAEVSALEPHENESIYR